MTQPEYLVAYDYGMGGLWAVMIAPSAEAITAECPELVIVEERPTWMDDDRYGQLRDDALELNGAPRGILNAVLADRRPRST
jgi:hypothetical protein